MSELVIANKSELVDVADAIRNKTGKTAGMSLSEMPSAISGIDGAVTPTISVSSDGLITATTGKKSATKQLDIQGAKTVTPSTSSQIAVAKDVYTTGTITVGAIPDNYIVDDEIAAQDTLIANIKTALEEKTTIPALETCTVEIGGGCYITHITYTTVNNDGEVIYAHIAPNSTETQTITALCNSVVTVTHNTAMYGTAITGGERIAQHQKCEIYGLTTLAGETAIITLFVAGGGSN